MSSALAVAGVSAMLRSLLHNWMIDQNVSGALGSNVSVTASPPDSIKVDAGSAQTQINLFLHQVTPNSGWRNAGLPSRDDRGDRLSNSSLAIDLHYLLTAYGAKDLHAEVVLGYAMHFLHDHPVLDRKGIRDVLSAGTSEVPGLAAGADLADQVEQIKITPSPMNVEEMSRLWSALQAHYRPTAAYQVSVVLIEGKRPARSALPVLTRGEVDPVTKRERGVVAEPGLVPPVPAIDAVRLPDGQPGARLGETVDVLGHHLDGTARTAVMANARFDITHEIPAAVGGGATLAQFTVPNAPAGVPSAIYRLTIRLVRPGETDPRTTNALPLVVAPEITTSMPFTVTRDGAGTATVGLTCRPDVRPGQRASLVLGDREAIAEPFSTSTASLTFVFAHAPVGSHLARLRVDGIESLVIDRSKTPPVFFDHRITIQ
jgi:hypothetical protein